jgi:arginyl-tRNA synthetase
VITGDLDAELARSLRRLADAGGLPAAAVRPGGGTWRPVPGAPASYATSLPFEVARLAGRPPAGLAARLAPSLRALPWVQAAEPSGAGYLIITVTAAALARVAERIAAAGPGCARSDALRGTAAACVPWPDPAAAASWAQAREEQAGAMTARLAEAAGATISPGPERERDLSGLHPVSPGNSPVPAAVRYFGVSAVRYVLARTPPERLGQLTGLGAGDIEPYRAVQLAHAEAASALRWAAELNLRPLGADPAAGPGERPATSPRDPAAAAGPAEQFAVALGTAPERELLAALSWLPERVASAARRNRPDEVPRYLEEVVAAWTACRLAAPALPFGGAAAAGGPVMAGARLLLADAARAVLAAGLSLAGISARGRI